MADPPALKVAKRAVKVSRSFWGLDPLWEIAVELGSLDEYTCAEVTYLPEYKRATITIDAFQCETDAGIWQHTAHEVAHLALAEHAAFYNLMQAQHDDNVPPVLESAWTHMVESQTRRLEYAFLKVHPYKP